MPRAKRSSSETREAANFAASTPGINLESIAGDVGVSLDTSQIAKALRVSPETVNRWRVSGVIGRDGRLHRLSSFRIGRRGYTRKVDLDEFLDRINAGRS